ncbi:hypothetical protein H0H92_004962 [Tricholoma furcatifolium]|nr:hypothetical protein H0H92_004962 [Tricholoma furcatifolium]
MPKAHRAGSTGLTRSHSRTGSSSKLGANLQFTSKDQYPPKAADKPKRNGISHDNNQGYNKGITRVASAQRTHSREYIQPLTSKQRAPHPSNTKAQQGKAGFTLASSGDDHDDDGEWESESGGATPNQAHTESDTDSDDEEAIRRLRQAPPPRPANGARTETAPPLPRIETVRQSDFRTSTNPPQMPQQQTSPPSAHRQHNEPRVPYLPPIKTAPAQQPHTQGPHSADAEMSSTRSAQETPSPGHSSPRNHKRHSSTRPPSSHSIRSEHGLRPHPLIRGFSYNPDVPTKPAPLEPLTAMQDSSTSGSDSILQGNELSTSPTSSLRVSPGGADSRAAPHGHRRQSVSSARSVSTLAVQSGFRDSDRKRTLSTVSRASSSAALSSLTHLPTTAARLPSTTFFPNANPHANIEAIHPLLPGPYLNSHLTVLARRTPIKEAFDRVIRAKQARS